MTRRRPFSKPVQREIVNRATRGGKICCEGCGMVLDGKKYEIDHIIAEALVPEWRKREKLTAKDGQLLGNCCHRGPDGKTNKDIKAAAKTQRQQDKARGISKPKGRLKSAGFPKTEKHRPIDKSALPPLGGPELARRAGR